MTHDRSNRRDASHEGASRRFGVDLSLSVDDLWLQEWAAEGIERLAALLAAHAAFDEFVRGRNNGGDECHGC